MLFTVVITEVRPNAASIPTQSWATDLSTYKVKAEVVTDRWSFKAHEGTAYLSDEGEDDDDGYY